MDLKLSLVVICALSVGVQSFPRKTISKHFRDDKLGIYNGVPTTIQRHPYLVSILSGDTNIFECAGTILSDNWIITSRDCIQSLDIESLKVMASSNDGYTGESYTVNKIVYHPDYSFDVTAYDYEYALVQISGMFQWSSKVKAVTLPTSQLGNYVKGMVVGWSSNNGTDRTLLQGGMTWFPKHVCNNTFSGDGITWTDRMACAYSYSRTTLCEFDWGDPFVQKGLLHGVFVSNYPSTSCSANSGPVLLADIFPVVDWINNITGAGQAQ